MKLKFIGNHWGMRSGYFELSASEYPLLEFGAPFP